MTQSVLKNEITELAPRSMVSADARKEVADAVSSVLADSYRLLINTQGLHWNVEGPLFYSVHRLTETHYRDLVEAIDDLGERVRALGMPAPQSLKELTERSIIEDLPTRTDLKTRIERMISDYERATHRATLIVSLAESHGDIRTADLLTERIGVYEQNAWMLRATIAS